MQIETAVVNKHLKIGVAYRLMVLASAKIAPQVRPGQFVHLRVAERNDLVLRRPFSVFKAGRPGLSILYKIVGQGTEILAGLRPGDQVSLMGPLGNGFPLPAPGSHPLLVAGGYGSAALYLLAEKIKQKGVLFIGGQTSADILCAADFKKIGWKVMVATEDGSMGHKGLVTDILVEYLSKNIVGRAFVASPSSSGHDRRFASEGPTKKNLQRQMAFYACGPMGMLQAVSDIAIKGGWQAWLSLDRNLGCGVGACLACVQKIKKPCCREAGDDWEWGRVCTEGPVFECREIVWE